MSLIDTNPYLRDPAMREYYVTRSVKSSTQVEGIKSQLQEIKLMTENTCKDPEAIENGGIPGCDCDRCSTFMKYGVDIDFDYSDLIDDFQDPWQIDRNGDTND